MWSRTLHSWNRVHKRWATNAVADTLEWLLGHIVVDHTNWWKIKRSRQIFVKQTAFLNSVTEQVVNLLMSVVPPEFDSEICRPLFTFKNG